MSFLMLLAIKITNEYPVAGVLKCRNINTTKLRKLHRGLQNIWYLVRAPTTKAVGSVDYCVG